MGETRVSDNVPPVGGPCSSCSLVGGREPNGEASPHRNKQKATSSDLERQCSITIQRMVAVVKYKTLNIKIRILYSVKDLVFWRSGIFRGRGVVAQLASDGGCRYNGSWQPTHIISDTVFVTGTIIIRPSLLGAALPSGSMKRH